jgi:hypothetical protein
MNIPIYFKKMMHVPTDLEIMNEIYEKYYDKFASYSKTDSRRTTKIYVPIKIDAIAEECGVDNDIIFGRLYYHLEKKYGYKNEDGSSVHLFARVLGDEKHCVNFPLVASVLADLRRENNKFWIATSIAIFSLIISIISFAT